jgi:hypothetical protein
LSTVTGPSCDALVLGENAESAKQTKWAMWELTKRGF